MQIIESILGTALLGFAAIAFMEVAEQRIHERDAIAAAEDVRAVQAAVIQHHRRNPHDTISEWITGGYPPCPAGYTGTGTEGQCRRDVTANNPYCPEGTLGSHLGLTRCRHWTHGGCPSGLAKDHTGWCVGRPFYHYSCDAQDTHHGVQTAVGMGMGMGANALPGGNPWCERALEIPWKDLRDVAPERLGALNFQGRLFHGLHRSPYSSEYRLMTNGVDDTLRLEFEVTGLDEMARLMYGDRLPGKQVDVEPRPDAAVHGEDTVFTVGVGITPGLSNAFSKYALDAVDRGADGTEGALESPLYWADTRLDDGVTETVPGGDCSRFGNGAFEMAANGALLICRALTPGGALTWKPAHTIDSSARLTLASIGECTGAQGEAPIDVPKAAIDAALGRSPHTSATAPEINLATGQMIFKDAFGALVHTVHADTWRATAAIQGSACLKESGVTTQCHDGTNPPCTPRQPAACADPVPANDSALPLSKADYTTLTGTAHTWAWGTGNDSHLVIATKDSDGSEIVRVSRTAWNYAVGGIGTGGSLCIKEAPPRACPEGQVLDEPTQLCKPDLPLCDWEGKGEDLPQYNKEFELLKYFLGHPNNAASLWTGVNGTYMQTDPSNAGGWVLGTAAFYSSMDNWSTPDLVAGAMHGQNASLWGNIQCFNKPGATLVHDMHTRQQLVAPLLDSNPRSYRNYDAQLQRFSDGVCHKLSLSLEHRYWYDKNGYFHSGNYHYLGCS